MGGIVAFAVLCLLDFLWQRRKKGDAPSVEALAGARWFLEDLDEDHEARLLLPPSEPKKKKTIKEYLSALTRKKETEKNTPEGEE
jgi:hypothetical protein